MSDPKVQQSLVNLEAALGRLQEALQEPEENSLVIDGTIQRFEFVLELYWKTLKRILAYGGIQTHTPRETLRQAYQARWLNDEALWLQMLDDRNRTSHLYNEAMARQIYERIKTYLPAMERTFRFLKQQFDISGGG
ncbi:MAG: nucleotidyltransferase [Caldilineae bacterium]|nr:MAG: nucleotidyltransferase [Caldilineae bacterium]